MTSINAPTPVQAEILRQLFLDGPTWDGDIISKQARNEVILMGLAERDDGYTQLTRDGLRYALISGFDVEKGIRDARNRTSFRTVSDNDGHHYVIPSSFMSDWAMWLDLNLDEVPSYAWRVEGGLTFHWPVEHGVNYFKTMEQAA
ncbi:hypothetical protein [Methylobacterium indicum]|uniref:Uncharacterized protein n=1 Tax=Methylobacterium indicum TaxID=1775910 RepID=A0A8H8X0J0_9HYPH|nr:hypothetical protein [Methylobacterium indicum]BCM87878.1 hypothetical protein mvi_63390 [Methylobacterium indicum]